MCQIFNNPCPLSRLHAGTLQQCSSAIDHLKRIIKHKASSLNQPSAKRRIPRFFFFLLFYFSFSHVFFFLTRHFLLRLQWTTLRNSLFSQGFPYWWEALPLQHGSVAPGAVRPPSDRVSPQMHGAPLWVHTTSTRWPASEAFRNCCSPNTPPACVKTSWRSEVDLDLDYTVFRTKYSHVYWSRLHSLDKNGMLTCN